MRKNLMKKISVLLAVIMLLGIMPVGAQATAEAAVSELINASFNDKTAETSADGALGDFELRNWGKSNVLKFDNAPERAEGDIAVSSYIATDEYSGGYLHIWNNNTTSNAIDNEKILYLSTDLYLPEDFGGSLTIRFDSTAIYEAIAQIEFEANSKLSVRSPGRKIEVGSYTTKKWYSLGVLWDKENQLITYFIDGEEVSVAKNVPSLTTNTEFRYISVSLSGTRTKDYTMYYDNMKVYSVPTYSHTIEVTEELPLPESVAVTLKDAQTSVLKSITWDTSKFDNAVVGDYRIIGTIADINIPVAADVKVQNTAIGANAVVNEIINLSFNDKTAETSADGALGDFELRNWGKSNVLKFDNAPERAEGDIAVSSYIATDEYSGGYLHIWNNNTTSNAIDNEKMLYLSTDLYLPEDFGGSLTIRFDSNAIYQAIAQIEFEANSKLSVRSPGRKIEVGSYTTKKWYSLGVLWDKENQLITYFIDGEVVSVAKNVPSLTTNTEFRYISVSLSGTRNKDYTMYYDNMKVYGIPTISATAEQYSELKMSNVINVMLKGAEQGVLKSVAWDKSSFNSAVVGDYVITGTVADINIPVSAAIKVTELAADADSIFIDEIYNATFDLDGYYTEGASAHDYSWGGNQVKVANWVSNSPKFVKDPDSTRSGYSVSCDITKDDNFSATFRPQGDYKTATLNADLLYVTTDVYFPENFAGRFDLYFSSVINIENMARVIFTADTNIIISSSDGSYNAMVEAPMKHGKWYNVGALVDKKNKTVSYYLDNKLVAENVPGWADTEDSLEVVYGMIHTKPTETYTMYFDNIAAYDLTKYEKTWYKDTEFNMPENVRILKDLITNNGTTLNITSTAVTEAVEWDTSDVDFTMPGKYAALGKTADSAIPVPAEITVKTVFELPYLISDGMLIQRDKPIKLWGYGAEETVTATIKDGDTTLATGTAEPDGVGNWSMELSALGLGGPYTIEFVTGETTETVNDVLIGELWAFDGQSNMGQTVPNIDWLFDADNKCAPTEKLEQVRVFIEDNTESPLWQRKNETAANRDLKFENVKGSWYVLDPADADSLKFSAIGCAYLVEMYSRLGIPMGGYDISLGGCEIHSFYPGGDVFRAGTLDEINTNIRGILFYQGEANKTNASDTYKGYMKELVEKLRGADAWNDPTIEFIYAQLPGYTMDTEDAEGNKIAEEDLIIQNWSNVRDAQLNAIYEIENSGMVTTLDILPVREYDTIHSTNKKIIGKRFAEQALGSVYGRGNVFQAPLFGSVEIEGAKATVTFTNVGDGLKTTDGEAPREFEIKGTDGVWYPASAAIISANQVVLTNESVTAIENVRYLDILDSNYTDEVLAELKAKGKPDVNLVNSAGLPASSFSENAKNYTREEIKADITVTDVKITTAENEAVTLPETVSVTYADGTTAEKAVTWLDTADTSVSGKQAVKGLVADSAAVVYANITIGELSVCLEDADGIPVNSLYNYSGSLYVSVENAIDGQKAIIAIYDANNRLLEVKTATVADGKAKIGFDTVPTGAATAKGMLWQSWATMLPIEKIEIDNTVTEVYVSATAEADGDGSLENPFATVYEAKEYVASMSSEEKSQGVSVNF